ncbi:hypothetical protein Rsub_12519 [Raphidocelis subcapitata]|uniref:Arginine biosynthesis bifunctional protein ArgJ, chloroplastic n=1 Tax=Raphidocelis subcapitata TaxID=307507 RepID=A0A2V0PIV5_9CHLO|nr:hypothetical protein Rsub_12519 [Raphidocelis subcapitata]|eukprot:GBF99744.1 hypothetical protein Rsub_12519 [Raphidocelis subcapitata]
MRTMSAKRSVGSAAGRCALMRPALRPFVSRQTSARVRAEVSTAADSFSIPAVPDLIPDGPWKKVLTNAGQANAATGSQGYEDAVACADKLAECLGVGADDVLIMSTGVIGRRLKMEAFLPAIPQLPATLGATADDAHRAAVAITTTDLVSKEAALSIKLGGVPVSVGGMCKGSGMIHPNMATMLGVVTTDADVDVEVWRGMLRRATDASFNSITVDGDTSTNDTVIGLASGKAGAPRVTDAGSADGKALEAAVTALLQGLAKAIAWDGVAFDQNDLSVQLGDIKLMKAGQPLAFDQKAASKYLKDTTGVHGTVHIAVGIGSGPGSGVAWGCDLSYDYVKINGEYTT